MRRKVEALGLLLLKEQGKEKTEYMAMRRKEKQEQDCRFRRCYCYC